MTQAREPITGASSDAASDGDDHRTRRSLLVAALGAAGAFVASAIGRPATAEATSVVVGANNNETAQTKFTNTAANANAWALSGTTSYTGSASGSRGVVGTSNGQNGVGVAGQANTGASANGVLGNATHGTGVKGIGTYGVTGSGSSTGVFGIGPDAGVYGFGSTSGVYGMASTGVEGVGDGTQGWGVHGVTNGGGNAAYGVVGEGGYMGVRGFGSNTGVYGESVYTGVWGLASATLGSTYGVYGASVSIQGYAGYFAGAVYVNGTLGKAGGGFMVDHPLAPADKYLIHSFVEAPERLNVYSGTVTLDRNGEATVALPDYFEAANRDVRYQLTAIGGPGPNLHVSREVHANAFGIAGGSAGQSVSWQVTAARQDAWAKANPLVVEPDKRTDERGKYLHPELHGASEKHALHRLRAEALPAKRTKSPARPPA